MSEPVEVVVVQTWRLVKPQMQPDAFARLRSFLVTRSIPSEDQLAVAMARLIDALVEEGHSVKSIARQTGYKPAFIRTIVGDRLPTQLSMEDAS